MLLQNQPLPPDWYEFLMDWKALRLFQLEDIFRSRFEVELHETCMEQNAVFLQSHLAIYLLVKNELKEFVRILS